MLAFVNDTTFVGFLALQPPSYKTKTFENNIFLITKRGDSKLFLVFIQV